ncbi:MAG: hypothetical protein ACE5HC_03000 [Candidatus Binatia bacterium]
MSPGVLLSYDSSLMEEAVFLALQGHPAAVEFFGERNKLYEISDSEEQERAFRDFHCAWFTRLEFADQIEKAVNEHPFLTSSVRRCVVACVSRKQDEGAELFVGSQAENSEKERRTVRILLRPESFLDSLTLLRLLRHELLHITDMLSTSFGYDPILPKAPGGPAYDQLLQDRYRVLWDATIDGRMVRRGWAPDSIRVERLCEFRHAFPMFREAASQLFDRFFDQEPHTHGELVTFACNPMAAVDDSPMTRSPGSRCPLCGFPTYAFEPAPEHLPLEVLSQITQDFPRWRPTQGLCTQCADLYRARWASSRAESPFPGT